MSREIYYPAMRGLFFLRSAKSRCSSPSRNCCPAIRWWLKRARFPSANIGIFSSPRTAGPSLLNKWWMNYMDSSVPPHHMIADVPVGVLLSGGVDSSAMLSFAVRETGKQVNTFTVGFDGAGVVDERPYARMAAEKFGASHHEISISSENFWDFLPAYVWHMEEPVCEPPAVALYYVSKLAREHVKVLLSGEGGDEAFAGYPNYANQMWPGRMGSMVGPLGQPLAPARPCLAGCSVKRGSNATAKPLAARCPRIISAAPPARRHFSIVMRGSSFPRNSWRTLVPSRRWK